MSFFALKILMRGTRTAEGCRAQREGDGSEIRIPPAGGPGASERRLRADAGTGGLPLAPLTARGQACYPAVALGMAMMMQVVEPLA